MPPDLPADLSERLCDELLGHASADEVPHRG